MQGWIRWRVSEAVQSGLAEVRDLPREMAIVGTRLMDLYLGGLTPREASTAVLHHLQTEGRLEHDRLKEWLNVRGGYDVIELLDGSKWAIRLGPADGRYVHLHPGRWSPRTMRVQANTLKSAVMANALAKITGRDALDLAIVNEARELYLGLEPIRKLSGAGGLRAVIELLGRE